MRVGWGGQLVSLLEDILESLYGPSYIVNLPKRGSRLWPFSDSLCRQLPFCDTSGGTMFSWTHVGKPQPRSAVPLHLRLQWYSVGSTFLTGRPFVVPGTLLLVVLNSRRGKKLSVPELSLFEHQFLLRWPRNAFGGKDDKIIETRKMEANMGEEKEEMRKNRRQHKKEYLLRREVNHNYHPPSTLTRWCQSWVNLKLSVRGYSRRGSRPASSLMGSLEPQPSASQPSPPEPREASCTHSQPLPLLWCLPNVSPY